MRELKFIRRRVAVADEVCQRLKFFRALNQITVVAVVVNQVRNLYATFRRDCRISVADCHGVDAVLTRNVVAVNFKACKLRELRGVDCQLEFGALRNVLNAVERQKAVVVGKLCIRGQLELESLSRAVARARRVVAVRQVDGAARVSIAAVVVGN